MRVITASGGGAANVVITVTDGTNTCTATFACAGSGDAQLAGTGAKVVSVVDGAGTGCTYAPGARVLASVTTGGACTTTQPQFLNLEILGRPL